MPNKFLLSGLPSHTEILPVVPVGNMAPYAYVVIYGTKPETYCTGIGVLIVVEENY